MRLLTRWPVCYYEDRFFVVVNASDGALEDAARPLREPLLDEELAAADAETKEEGVTC